MSKQQFIDLQDCYFDDAILHNVCTNTDRTLYIDVENKMLIYEPLIEVND